MDVITQAQAEAQGLKRYFTGVPCLSGHLAERYVRGRGCVECKAAPRNFVARPRVAGPGRQQPVEVESAPQVDERVPVHRDPGTHISQDRIDALIEQVFNDGPRAAVRDAA